VTRKTLLGVPLNRSGRRDAEMTSWFNKSSTLICFSSVAVIVSRKSTALTVSPRNKITSPTQISPCKKRDVRAPHLRTGSPLLEKRFRVGIAQEAHAKLSGSATEKTRKAALQNAIARGARSPHRRASTIRDDPAKPQPPLLRCAQFQGRLIGPSYSALRCAAVRRSSSPLLNRPRVPVYVRV